MVFVHTLGQALIEAGTSRVTPGSIRKFALLLYLSAEPGRRTPRSVLRDLIFPDATEKNARHSLREMAYQLRRAGVEIDSDDDGIALCNDAVKTDYVEILARDRFGIQDLSAIEGGFLPGYSPTHSEAFCEWLDGYRARATFKVCQGVLIEISRATERGDWGATERAARACLALDPLNEKATFAIARMLAVSGARVEAVRVLDKFEQDLGDCSDQLSLPVRRLRRRICERLPEVNRPLVQLPFVGREREMIAMNRRFGLAKDGQPQCVTLIGEAGIGKSRLTQEFSSLCALDGARVESVSAQPSDANRPMAAFVDVIPALLKLPGALGCSPISMESLARLTRYERSDISGALPSRDSSEAVSRAIARAIVDLIDAVTSESPLILLLEDAHWLDAASLDVLSSLLAARVSRRLLILLTSRNRLSDDFASRLDSQSSVLPVSPLSRESTRSLVESVLRDSDAVDDESFQKWLADTSGGNPLYVRFLTDHFRATRERYSLSPRLSDLIDQRVTALDSDGLSVLQTATLLGNHATLDRLQRVLEITHIRLFCAIRHLEATGLLLQDGDRATAAHPLIADSLERLSTPLSVRLLRRRIATILERELGQFAPAAHLWALAEHWVAAGDVERGLSVLRDCARHALEIGRPRRAAEILLEGAALPLAADERQRVLEDAIRTADSASELDVLLKASDLIGDIAVVHEDIELARVLARICCRRNLEIDEPVLRRFVSATGASISHRLRAGLAMLVLADLNCEPAIASDVFARLTDVLALPSSVDDADALKVQLIYHSSFGDIDISVAAADGIAKVASGSPPIIAADLLRKAAIGYWRAGRIQEFWEAIKGAHAAAITAGVQRLMFLISIAAVSAEIDSGDGRGLTWLAILDEFIMEHPEFEKQFEHVAIRWELSVYNGDRLEAERCQKAARQAAILGTTERPMRWLRAMETRMNYDAGFILNAEFAAKNLCRTHREYAEIGDCSDAEVATCLYILIDLGRLDDARGVAANYLAKDRRSRAPLCRLLKDQVDRLGSLCVAAAPDALSEEFSHAPRTILTAGLRPAGVAF